MKRHIIFYIILFLSVIVVGQNNNHSKLQKAIGTNLHNCDAPEGIIGNEFWNSNDDNGVSIKWHLPTSAINEWYNYLSYDAGINNKALGMENEGDYSIAIRWDKNELAEYDGDTLKSMKIFIADSGFSQLIVKVWTGEYAVNNIYADTINIENININEWNEFVINEILTLDASKEYWAGYRIINQQAGYNPIGCWKGDCTLGYSDMVSFDAEEEIWDFASTWSSQYMWNIQLIVTNFDSEFKCKGFVLLRQTDDHSDYTYYDFIPNKRYVDQPVYYDTISDFPQNICYKVSTLWINAGDSCFSAFASDTVDNQDYVCVNYSKIYENNPPDELSIYPNPAGSKIILESDLNIKEIVIYNLNGKEVFSKPFSGNAMDISFLKRGFYMLSVKCDGGKTIREKLIKK